MKIKITKQHHAHFMNALISGAFDGKVEKIYRLNLLPKVIGVLSALLIIIHISEIQDFVFLDFLSIAIGLLISLGVYNLVQKIRDKRYWAKIDPHEEDPTYVETTYTLEPDGLLAESKKGSSKHYICSLLKLYEDDVMFILFQSNIRGFIFPKAQLTESEISELRNWANEKITF